MTEPLYRAHAKVEMLASLHRRAHLAFGHVAEFGVHGPIKLHYRLRIPAGTREVVDRALARHQEKCPTAATLKGAVQVSWTAEIEEA